MDNEKLTDQELVELDKRGLNLDWPEYEYDHTCREWAIGSMLETFNHVA